MPVHFEPLCTGEYPDVFFIVEVGRAVPADLPQNAVVFVQQADGSAKSADGRVMSKISVDSFLSGSKG